MPWMSLPAPLPENFIHYSSLFCTGKLSRPTGSLPSASSCSKISYLKAPQPHTVLLAPTLPSAQPNLLSHLQLFISLFYFHPTTPVKLFLKGHKIISLLPNPRHIFYFFLDFTLKWLPAPHPGEHLFLALGHNAPLVFSLWPWLLLLHMLVYSLNVLTPFCLTLFLLSSALTPVDCHPW